MSDGQKCVSIDAGFEIAPGDASDIEVANAHAWGSDLLVFSDGTGAYSASMEDPSDMGTASSFCK